MAGRLDLALDDMEFVRPAAAAVPSASLIAREIEVMQREIARLSLIHI